MTHFYAPYPKPTGPPNPFPSEYEPWVGDKVTRKNWPCQYIVNAIDRANRRCQIFMYGSPSTSWDGWVSFDDVQNYYPMHVDYATYRSVWYMKYSKIRRTPE